MRRSLPLRMRLALGYAAFFALVLILLGLGVYLAVRHALLQEMERQLQTSSALIEVMPPGDNTNPARKAS